MMSLRVLWLHLVGSGVGFIIKKRVLQCAVTLVSPPHTQHVWTPALRPLSPAGGFRSAFMVLPSWLSEAHTAEPKFYYQTQHGLETCCPFPFRLTWPPQITNQTARHVQGPREGLRQASFPYFLLVALKRAGGHGASSVFSKDGVTK